MSKGVVRKLDELGRLVLPIEYRRELNIDGGDKVDMYLLNGAICCEKALDYDNNICCSCKNTDTRKTTLIKNGESSICFNCLIKFNQSHSEIVNSLNQ